MAGLLCAGAQARPPAHGEVNFTSAPSFSPKFGPNIHDYVVGCSDTPVTVKAHTSPGWEAAIGTDPFLSGDFVGAVPLSAGRAFTITVRQVGHPERYRYYVRCLPSDFPTYTFTRYRPVSPKYFSVENFAGFTKRYAIIFNNDGVPMWWIHAPAQITKVLPDGTVRWDNRLTNQYEIHRLDGSLVRTLGAVGHPANPHDLQLLPNGDHLVGAYVKQSHVDTSAYGGSSDADVVNAELQEVSPGGQLVWDWKSQDHISLAETGRFWPWAVHNPLSDGYDIVHWNSIEPDGGSVIASFRHLDAVYKIKKSSGQIVWKLGGTATPESLRVLNDARSPTFGAQHDARLLPDGTLTVFDDRTHLAQRTPRAVRFRIDQGKGTATLVQSISDPKVRAADCCGSVRRLPNRDWLISWGKTNPVGGYTPDGKRTFLLSFDKRFSHRAEPVPTGVLSARDLREGMDAMCSSGCG
jgi:arylsulfotransferase ASST